MSLILCSQDSQTLYLLSKCKNKLLLKKDLLGPLSGHVEGELRTHVVSLRTVYQPRHDRPRTQVSAEGSYLPWTFQSSGIQVGPCGTIQAPFLSYRLAAPCPSLHALTPLPPTVSSFPSPNLPSIMQIYKAFLHT